MRMRERGASAQGLPVSLKRKGIQTRAGTLVDLEVSRPQKGNTVTVPLLRSPEASDSQRQSRQWGWGLGEGELALNGDKSQCGKMESSKGSLKSNVNTFNTTELYP